MPLDFCHQRLAGALRDAAVGLSLDDHGVHCPADVVDGRVAIDRDHSGCGIDFDLGDVTAVRE